MTEEGFTDAEIDRALAQQQEAQAALDAYDLASPEDWLAGASKICAWPSCLSADQKDELAAEVVRQAHGEASSPPPPDQRLTCRCVDL